MSERFRFVEATKSQWSHILDTQYGEKGSVIKISSDIEYLKHLTELLNLGQKVKNDE